MLTSRGEGAAANNRVAETALRAKMASMPYSFQQFHPVVPAARPARPPPPVARSSGDVRVSSEVRVAAAPNSGSAPTDADAHFPVLSQNNTSASRPYASSPANAFPPIAPGSAPSPTPSRWQARNPVTAADVVASRPPEVDLQSIEEEMAIKEQSKLAVFAQLVPRTSSIPRAPGRTLGRGGLRATGSVAGQQQQRNAAANARSPKNALLPPPSVRSRKDHLSNRLTSLTSDATKPQLARRVAAVSSKPKPLHLPPGLSSSADIVDLQQTLPKNPSASQAVEEVDTAQKEEKPDSSMPHPPSNVASTSRSTSIGASLRPGGATSSFRVAAAGLVTRTSTGKLMPRALSNAVKVVHEPNVATSKPHNEVSVSQGNTPERPSSPKFLGPAIADIQVLEQRRKAFAASPDTKAAKVRSSYHSARKSQQNNGRRGSHASTSGAQMGNGPGSLSKPGLSRADYASVNGFANRAMTGSGRGKPLASKVDAHCHNSGEKDVALKNGFADREVLRAPVLPTNARAEALLGGSSKKNGFRSAENRKSVSQGKEAASSTKTLGRRIVPSLNAGDVSKEPLPVNGSRARVSRGRINTERKEKLGNTRTVLRKQVSPCEYNPTIQGINIPQSALTQDRSARSEPVVLSPREKIEEDFPSRPSVPYHYGEVAPASSSLPMRASMPPASGERVPEMWHQHADEGLAGIPNHVINDLIDRQLGSNGHDGSGATLGRNGSAIDNNYPVPNYQEKLISWMDYEVKDPPATPNGPVFQRISGNVITFRHGQQTFYRDVSSVSMIDLMKYIQARARDGGTSSYEAATPMRTEETPNEQFDSMIERLRNEENRQQPQHNGATGEETANVNGNSGGVADSTTPSSLFYSHFS